MIQQMQNAKEFNLFFVKKLSNIRLTLLWSAVNTLQISSFRLLGVLRGTENNKQKLIMADKCLKKNNQQLPNNFKVKEYF